MICPHCESELEYEDEIWENMGDYNWESSGKIYRCPNDNCESVNFHYYFYVLTNDTELHEGYPF